MANYNDDDLAKFGAGLLGEEAPELWNEFMKYYGDVFQEGELTAREKSLIALGVATAIHCPYCIEAYTKDCLSKGVNDVQMTEAIHVAGAIRGGAALAHGIQMKNVVKKLEM